MGKLLIIYSIKRKKKIDNKKNNEIEIKIKLEQLKTSESKLQKIEEKELYFIIYYQRKQKENPEEIIFSEE